MAVSKSSDRDRNSTHAWCRASITCSPWVSPLESRSYVGDHQGVARGHQVQQRQEAAAVILGPAGLLGPDVADGTAGADQPLHLQVKVLVLRLPDRDPGTAVQRHPYITPGLEYLKYGFMPRIL